jgi:hypothetical protein
LLCHQFVMLNKNKLFRTCFLKVWYKLGGGRNVKNQNIDDVLIFSDTIGKIRTSEMFFGRKWTKTFNILILSMGFEWSERQKSFLTFDVLFNVLIFIVLINHFKKTFDVLILWQILDVLFDFWRSDFRSSDPFPINFLYFEITHKI